MKAYTHKQMQPAQASAGTREDSSKEEVYFFPKANPPVSVRAKSRVEAEEKIIKLRK